VDAALVPVLGRAARLQLHALQDNLSSFLRLQATTEPIKYWSLTSLRQTPI
jgi:hypothetical protein